VLAAVAVGLAACLAAGLAAGLMAWLDDYGWKIELLIDTE
jgi:hypothetical protein